MLSTERPEFEKHFGVLCAGLDVPCTAERKEAYWKSLQMMALSVFVRVIDHLLGEEEWRRMPKPWEIWAASKRMRAAAPERKEEDPWDKMPWEKQGNLNLLRHITTTLAKDAKRYGEPASYMAMRASPEDLKILGLDTHELDASPEFKSNVAKLVAAKNAWVAEMKYIAVDNCVPGATQRKTWDDYIGAAEREIDLRKAAA